MKIKFIYEKQKSKWGSTILRGFDISQRLSIEMSEVSESLNLIDYKLIFLKLTDYSILLELSEKNQIILDMVDFKSEDQLHLFKHFDYGIFTSEEQKNNFKNFFKFPDKCLVIYHHWDKRFNNLEVKKNNYPKICYFGEKNKCDFFGIFEEIDYYGINGRTFEDNIVNYVDYNCHYIIKPESHERLLQPMTKLSNASALNCPVIVLKRPQYVELLTDDYPYYVKQSDKISIENCIIKIEKTFNKEDWNSALKIMEKVKIKTSFESIINEYYTKIINTK
jgi:hypothetical protein